MSFLYPGWLLLLLVLPFLVLGAVLSHRRRNKAWQHMVAPRLRKQLVREGSTVRRWISLALGLLGCALLIVVIARPYIGETSTTEQIRTRNIIIAIDTSRSMLVRDVAPDRMGNAKAMALELVDAFPNDRIGIIAFSGAPVVMAPLTIDHSSVEETIAQLDTHVIPSGGSNLASAVELAITTFKKSGHKANALIVISDGEDHSEQIELAGSGIREAEIAVCTIGVGKTDGGIIPDRRSNDGKYRDMSGNTVHSRLHPEALEQLARAGRGSYVPATSGADTAIRAALSFLESDQQAGRKITVPTESYQWFLAPAIILLVLSVLVRSNLWVDRLTSPAAIRSATSVLAFITCLSSLQAATDLERATTAYDQKDYETALDFFTKAAQSSRGKDRHAIEFSQGTSAYRLKQWKNAAGYFSRSLLSKNPDLQAESHFNIGNSLFQKAWSQFKPATQGSTNPTEPQDFEVEDLEAAITLLNDTIVHYKSTLKTHPDHQRAEHNLKEAEKLLKQLEDKQQEEKEKQEQEKESDKNRQQGDGEKPENNDDNNKGNDPKQDPNEKGEGDQQNEPNDQPEDNGNKDSQQNTPKPQPQPERKDGESKEAFAARILKENADAETRPVTRRLLRLRRPAKDW